MTETIDTAEPVKKQRPGTFSASYQPKRRRSGDKIPQSVKQAVIDGLAAIGEDGKGKNGFRGYVTYLGRTLPKQAVRLIERLLPPSVVVANTGSKASITAVNVVSIPSGNFLSHEDIEKFRTGTVQLEHAPPQQLEQLEPLEQLEQLEPLEHFEPLEQPAALSEQIAPSSEADEEKTINNLKNEINELARKMGVAVVV